MQDEMGRAHGIHGKAKMYRISTEHQGERSNFEELNIQRGY
jgi:hypothetical protein